MKVINPYFSQHYTLNNKTRYKGYGVDAYIAFFEHIRYKQQDDSPAEGDERLCTFSSALASVKVTEAVTSFVRDAKLLGRN